MPLTRTTFTGPWAGLPVAWSDDDRFDEATYRADVARCCEAGIPGIYTGGTTGEFYAMEFDEFQEVARATVEECREHRTPAMIGCTSNYTRGTVRRAAFAAELGADAVQVALPYWMEVPDEHIVPFFREVAAACDGLAISIYDTVRAKRRLSVDQHRAIRDAVPGYLMVKATAGTIGSTVDGCAAISQFANVFVGEHLWTLLHPAGARGGCSSLVYWNPRVILGLWSSLEEHDVKSAEETQSRVSALHVFLQTFEGRGLTDTAYDRLGALASRFLKTSLRSRGPYPSATAEDVRKLREWFTQYFPEMLQHAGQL